MSQSDSNGKFSFTLPTSKSIGFRVFAKAIYQDNPTPKSKTLSYLVGSSGDYFINYILPWFVIIILLLTALSVVIYYEKKTKKLRLALSNFIERKLKPFAIRTGLRFRRLWYNVQKSQKLHQK